MAKGIHEIQAGVLSAGRNRRPGAGRKSITVSEPGLLEALEEMMDYQTRGDSRSPLRWICKSTYALAKPLGIENYPIRHAKVAQMFHELRHRKNNNSTVAWLVMNTGVRL